MSHRIASEVEDLVKNEVKERLAHDPTGVFSRTEVMRRLRQRIRWKGSGDSPQLARMRRKGMMSRRKFLHMLGLGVGGAFVTASGIGHFMGTDVFGNDEDGFLTGFATELPQTNTIEQAPGSTTVNLGDEGLSNGDSIDSYLDHFSGGNKVIIPEGTYSWSGDGISASDPDCSLIGNGEVTFNLDGSFGGGLRNDDGTTLVKNITIRGEADRSTKAGFDLAGGGTKIFDGVHIPDGTVNGAEGRAFYTPSDHSGIGVLRNVYAAGFSSDTFYTDDGEVIVQGCFTKNNNISMIRLGGSNSVSQNSVVVLDGDVKEAENGGRSARGIRIRQPGDNIVIENCHCAYTADNAYGGAPIELHDGANGGSGTIRNTKILNDTGVEAINDKGIGIDNWSAENVCIQGSGNLEHPFDSGVNEGNCGQIRDQPPWCYTDQSGQQENN